MRYEKKKIVEYTTVKHRIVLSKKEYEQFVSIVSKLVPEGTDIGTLERIELVTDKGYGGWLYVVVEEDE